MLPCDENYVTPVLRSKCSCGVSLPGLTIGRAAPAELGEGLARDDAIFLLVGRLKSEKRSLDNLR